MKTVRVLFSFGLYAIAFSIAPRIVNANVCNLSGCTNRLVTVKSGAANTCTGIAVNCDCFAQAQSLGYTQGGCMTALRCDNLAGDAINTCSSAFGGGVCCARPGGRDPGVDEEDVVADSVTEDISATLGSGEASPRTSSFWGYYNSTLKTQSAGVARDCEAKIHVCFVHGFSDLTGVTDQNGCNNACNSATNTNQNECFDTDCSSRCSGWWTGTDSCN